MPKRVDWLAVAIFSGIVARWISKQAMDENGEMKGEIDAGVQIEKTKLVEHYKAAPERIDGIFDSLKMSGKITVREQNGVIFASPIIRGIEYMFEGVGINEDKNGQHHFFTAPLIKPAPVAVEKKPDPSKWIIKRFEAKFQATRGAPYPFKGGRDAKAAKCLCKCFALVSMNSLTPTKIAEIDRLMDFYLAQQGKEDFTGGYSLHGIWDTYSALQTKLGVFKAPVQKFDSRYNDKNGKSKDVIFF